MGNGLGMTRIRVVYDCLIPNGVASEKDVTEWVAFHHKVGGISNNNPLYEVAPTPIADAIGWGTVGVEQ
ncbi:MAG: hypothetical protein PHQ60_02350 [Sideroxydans sp.]|nr:hypothetical protein [Sideroxydans sp.]MDD5056685.1 hypothetical protein [Sideroxydans sp.]